MTSIALNSRARWDVFISHASEDKDGLVRPLADALTKAGLRVWLDEQTLTLGDSLRVKIDQGLANSRYGLVILSPAFFEKQWPQQELDGLFAREDGTGKVILPIWHQVTSRDVRERSPLLAGRLAVSTDRGLAHVVQEIIRAVTPDSEVFEPVSTGAEAAVWHKLNALLLARREEPSTALLHLLIVDDEPIIRELLSRYFSYRGHSVSEARDGMEALEKFPLRHFDCVITDLMMPGMTGFDLVREIRKLNPSIPVVLVSAYYFHASEIDDNLDYDLFISKPVRLDTLHAALTEVSRGALRQVVFRSLPAPSRLFRLLYECREEICGFMMNYDSVDLFETALRHKIKDCVHSFTKAIEIGRVPLDAASSLRLQIQKVAKLMQQIRHGQSTGLMGYLDAIREDLAEEHPDIDFVLHVSDELASLEGDVVTFLILSAVELIANARDAVGDRGIIKVSARVRSSERTAVLKVSNSGQLPGSLGDRIFEEGVSTKGEGRGMGLAIVRRMAERFGGQVRLRQEKEVEIIVTVPVSGGPSKAPPTRNS